MEHKIMGYARVSSKEQKLDRQLIELKKYVPAENIIMDKQSGKDLNRPGYQALKGPLGLRQGDTLYIKSLDRLSRNKEDIKKELEWFKQNGIRLMILDLPTSMIQVPPGQEWLIEMINNILIEVLASIAQQERETIHARQREGINAARLARRHLGRPAITVPENFDDVVAQWKNGEITAREAMRQTGLKRSSFYKLVK
ncbi:recombinase family protein [Anaerotignum lactatifermentans]|uniref:recombinase family protein n=1 Tax=Anaerotignum lactatifermentans TaxID=160404 RepID=UPI0026731397|nr:recombinase family protein [Anaerotignum lactatifermentans]